MNPLKFILEDIFIVPKDKELYGGKNKNEQAKMYIGRVRIEIINSYLICITGYN